MLAGIKPALARHGLRSLSPEQAGRQAARRPPHRWPEAAPSVLQEGLRVAARAAGGRGKERHLAPPPGLDCSGCLRLALTYLQGEGSCPVAHVAAHDMALDGEHPALLLFLHARSKRRTGPAVGWLRSCSAHPPDRRVAKDGRERRSTAEATGKVRRSAQTPNSRLTSRMRLSRQPLPGKPFKGTRTRRPAAGGES